VDSTARRSSCTCHPSISRGSREVQSELEAFPHDAIPGRAPAASPRRWLQADSLGVSRTQPCESPSLWVVLFRIPWHMFRQTPSSSAQPKRTSPISPCPPESLAPLRRGPPRTLRTALPTPLRALTWACEARRLLTRHEAHALPSIVTRCRLALGVRLSQQSGYFGQYYCFKKVGYPSDGPCGRIAACVVPGSTTRGPTARCVHGFPTMPLVSATWTGSQASSYRTQGDAL